jgi:hypothetical protein
MRDGVSLARWMRERGIEAYVIRRSNIDLSCEHRRARTDLTQGEVKLLVDNARKADAPVLGVGEITEHRGAGDPAELIGRRLHQIPN